jgi:pimeloyl-ACP methyl ester carboxylesterase
VLNVWTNAKEVRSLHADSLKGIPVLVVWGKKDRTIYLRTGKRFVAHVPHAELIVIHGAGHDPMETHPDIFNSLLTGFLKRK